MHDRLSRIDEITEALAHAPLTKSGGVTPDELVMDAALIDLLFEKKVALSIQKDGCSDKSINSATYNELLMSAAEVVADIRGFEFKYQVQLMA